MNCRQCEDQLSALVDGELTAAQRAAVEAHVTGCARCQASEAGLRKMAGGIAALPRLEPGPQFLADVRRKIRGEAETTQEPNWIDRLFRPLWLKVPLEAVALLCIVGVVLMSTRHEPPVSKTASESMPESDGIEFRSGKPIDAEELAAGGKWAKGGAPMGELRKSEQPARGIDRGMLRERELAQNLTPTKPSLSTAAPPVASAPMPATESIEKLNFSSVARDVSANGSRMSGTSRRLDDLSKGAEAKQQSVPVETMLVAAVNVDEVRSRAASVAGTLRGRVISSEENLDKDAAKKFADGLGVQRIRVSLPTANVGAFKSRFAAATVKLKAAPQSLRPTVEGFGLSGQKSPVARNVERPVLTPPPVAAEPPVMSVPAPAPGLSNSTVAGGRAVPTKVQVLAPGAAGSESGTLALRPNAKTDALSSGEPMTVIEIEVRTE